MNLVNSQLTLVKESSIIAQKQYSPIATIELSLYSISRDVKADELVIIRSALNDIRNISSNLIKRLEFLMAMSHE